MRVGDLVEVIDKGKTLPFKVRGYIVSFKTPLALNADTVIGLAEVEIEGMDHKMVFPVTSLRVVTALDQLAEIPGEPVRFTDD